MLKSILTGGVVLATRNVVGMGIMLVGNVVIIRTLGLGLFGLQSIATFLGAVLASIAEFSIGLYIVRRPGELPESETLSAFTLLQLLSWIVAAFGILIVAPLAAWWYGHRELLWLIAASSTAIALAAPGKIPSALLEREMRYGRTSAAELGASVVYYVAALIGLAWKLGIWALVVAEIARAVGSSVFLLVAHPMRYRLKVNRGEARRILRFGISMSSSTWVWMLASGVNPLVIGKVIGVEATGLVRLAQGLLNQTSTLTSALSRISINVFGKIQEQRDTVLRAVNACSVYAYVAITLPSLLLVVASPWLMPRLYHVQGPTITTLLLLAVLPQSISALMMSQTFLLMARGEGSYLTKLHVIRSALVWLGCLMLVRSLGVFAAAVAEIVGAAALLILHRRTVSLYGSPDYRPALALLVTGYGVTLLLVRTTGTIVGMIALSVASLICFALVLYVTDDRLAFRAFRTAQHQLLRRSVSVGSGVA